MEANPTHSCFNTQTPLWPLGAPLNVTFAWHLLPYRKQCAQPQRPWWQAGVHQCYARRWQLPIHRCHEREQIWDSSIHHWGKRWHSAVKLTTMPCLTWDTILTPAPSFSQRQRVSGFNDHDGREGDCEGGGTGPGTTECILFHQTCHESSM